ncbi:MAG TPA: kelch repeat-containing protein, partial [Bacteroidales bacterium]|nr:kelch repeat-containing protein [Bacteroidales bacterium]
MKQKILPRVMLLMAFCLTVFQSSGQSYGLHFSGMDVPVEKRTGIDLDENGFLQLDERFSLSFDILFQDKKDFQYGYIARIITRDGQNIDLVYDCTSSPQILVVCQQELSSIAVKLHPGDISRWLKLKLNFDIENDHLYLEMLDSTWTELNAGLKHAKDFKILFGENNYSIYGTSSVAPMDIRDIVIRENDVSRFHWPLNEMKGNYARDILRDKKAVVKNPVWLTSRHQKWELLHAFTVKGNNRVVFSEQEEAVYIIGDQVLIRFNTDDRTFKQIYYKSGKPVLNEGSQGFINPKTNDLYTYSFEQKLISKYDPSDSVWGYEPILRENTAALRHYNRFFLSRSQSLYIIGGFNGLKYSNSVYCLDLAKGKWRKVKTGGDPFSPRYLAALGLNRNEDTAYILGGYGSDSGNPILNPHFYTDLYSYSINDSSFHKVYDYENSSLYYSFANSMVIDSANHNFYVLQFNANQSKSALQLLQGSLIKPHWQVMADKIPFYFREKNSYADLFIGKNRNKLYTVVSYFSDSIAESTVKIYSLFYPPNISEAVVLEKAGNARVLYWFIVIVGIDLLIILFIAIRKRIRKNALQAKKKGDQTPENSFFSDDLLKNTWEDQQKSRQKEKQSRGIYLFGGFQFYDAAGEEISRKFSPLLRELFLMILLHSINNGKGISSKVLIELLWWDKSANSAKNNLSVNIGKLRNILGPELKALLISQSGYWKFELEGKEKIIYCDYFEC